MKKALALFLILASLAMTACGGNYYKEKALAGYTASATATEAGKASPRPHG